MAILVIIALPSFKILFFQLNTPPADLTIKVTGVTWNWKYNYPDNGDFEFDSLMLTDKERKADQPRLLSVDNEMVVPVNKVVRVQVTGFDVIHAFAVPSFGIKIDAIPGRLNETWFTATRDGWYYGQCSELCGKDHAFMPIAVRVVSEAEFGTWIEEAKKKFGAAAAPEILKRTLDKSPSTGTVSNADMTVGEPGDRPGIETHGCARGIDDDEVVACALHLGKFHAHRGQAAARHLDIR